MAGSRRDLVILPRIRAKFHNSTVTDPYHDVSGLGKVADFAPSIFQTPALLQVSISATSLREGRGVLPADLLPGGPLPGGLLPADLVPGDLLPGGLLPAPADFLTGTPLPGGLLPADLVTGAPLPARLLSADLVTPCGGFLSRGLLFQMVYPKKHTMREK